MRNRSNERWTKLQNDFLLENKNSMSLEELSTHTGRSINSIRRKIGILDKDRNSWELYFILLTIPEFKTKEVADYLNKNRDYVKYLYTSNTSYRKGQKSRIPSFIQPGYKFGDLEVEEKLEYKDKHGCHIWRCRCKCGNILTKTSAQISKKRSLSCMTCGHRKSSIKQFKGIGNLTGSYWSRVIRGARDRNIEFNITKEYAWKLYLEQNKKCALTGLDIVFAKNNKEFNSRFQTASLDRICSKKGYIEGNVQWVHKQVQFMKGPLEQNYFIEMCSMIHNYNNIN